MKQQGFLLSHDQGQLKIYWKSSLLKSKLLQAAAATLALRENNIQSSVAVSYKNLSRDCSPPAVRVSKPIAIGEAPPKSSALNVILSVNEEDEEDSSLKPKVSEMSMSGEKSLECNLEDMDERREEDVALRNYLTSVEYALDQLESVDDVRSKRPGILTAAENRIFKQLFS